MCRVNRELGKRIKLRRQQIGMTQTTLGKSCQITAQQMCKYEQGQNSITAARLLEIADILNTTPGAFLEGLEDASTYTENS